MKKQNPNQQSQVSKLQDIMKVMNQLQQDHGQKMEQDKKCYRVYLYKSGPLPETNDSCKNYLLIWLTPSHFWLVSGTLTLVRRAISVREP